MSDLAKTRIAIQGRSDGDGMENTCFGEGSERGVQKFSEPEAPFIKYYPNNFVTSPGKRKEPKFVPYEPYKAAVSPMIPTVNKYEKHAPTNCVIDSQKVSSLASSVIKLNSCKEVYSDSKNVSLPVNDLNGVNEVKCDSSCEKKICSLEEKISHLEKEKKELESQFRIQTEVNSDLKKMLVAALGEDMQLKVQYMTEDKARLGMNVLHFTEELRKKNEEIDRLAVQCDVWKSKFEASSLMVDELAGWKVALSRKLGESVQVIDCLLKEHEMIAHQLYTSYSILRHIQAAFNPSSHISKSDHSSQSLLNFAKEIQSLSSCIQDRLLGKSSPAASSTSCKSSRQLTSAEALACQILSSFNNLPLLMQFESTKGVKHGPGTTACQILPHICTKDPILNCCKHCSGDIKQI